MCMYMYIYVCAYVHVCGRCPEYIAAERMATAGEN